MKTDIVSRLRGPGIADYELDLGVTDAAIREIIRLRKIEEMAVIDCRQCAYFTVRAIGCTSLVRCIDAGQFMSTPPRQFWTTTTLPPTKEATP